MGIFDSMSVKYGAVICGYIMLGLPIFRKKSTDTNLTASTITKEYIKNSSLLINLAKVLIQSYIGYWQNTCFL